jgi:hypothetical protein
MPRLVNAVTGVFVNVSDETSANLGSEWKSEAAKSESDDKPARRVNAAK